MSVTLMKSGSSKQETLLSSVIFERFHLICMLLVKEWKKACIFICKMNPVYVIFTFASFTVYLILINISNSPKF